MYITIKDITGEVHTSDEASLAEIAEAAEWTLDEARENVLYVVEVLKDFSKLNTLSLTIGGVDKNFNPAHIVSIDFHGLEELDNA